jgi:hypothetical protein
MLGAAGYKAAKTLITSLLTSLRHPAPLPRLELLEQTDCALVNRACNPESRIGVFAAILVAIVPQLLGYVGKQTLSLCDGQHTLADERFRDLASQSNDSEHTRDCSIFEIRQGRVTHGLFLVEISI